MCYSLLRYGFCIRRDNPSASFFELLPFNVLLLIIVTMGSHHFYLQVANFHVDISHVVKAGLTRSQANAWLLHSVDIR